MYDDGDNGDGDNGDDNREPIQLLFQMAPHPESLGELGKRPVDAGGDSPSQREAR